MSDSKVVHNIISYRFKKDGISGETKSFYYTPHPVKCVNSTAREIEKWMKVNQRLDQIRILEINGYKINTETVDEVSSLTN